MGRNLNWRLIRQWFLIGFCVLTLISVDLMVDDECFFDLRLWSSNKLLGVIMLKGLLGGMDNQISSFTKILQRKRSPIQIGPDGTTQELLYKLGLTSIGNTQSPEATIALIMKEYVSLRAYPIDTQISVIEFRVFGKNCSSTDPSFSTLEEWISWRLPRAFFKHKFHACDGWTLEFYKFARERALEHFV